MMTCFFKIDSMWQIFLLILSQLRINFLASINKLLSTDGISLERGSFIYSTSGLKSGFTD